MQKSIWLFSAAPINLMGSVENSRGCFAAPVIDGQAEYTSKTLWGDAGRSGAVASAVTATAQTACMHQ